MRPAAPPHGWRVRRINRDTASTVKQVCRARAWSRPNDAFRSFDPARSRVFRTWTGHRGRGSRPEQHQRAPDNPRPCHHPSRRSGRALRPARQLTPPADDDPPDVQQHPMRQRGREMSDLVYSPRFLIRGTSSGEPNSARPRHRSPSKTSAACAVPARTRSTFARGYPACHPPHGLDAFRYTSIHRRCRRSLQPVPRMRARSTRRGTAPCTSTPSEPMRCGCVSQDRAHAERHERPLHKSRLRQRHRRRTGE